MNDNSMNDNHEYDWDILDKCLIQNNKDEGRKENEGGEEDETSSQEGDLEEDCEAELNEITETLDPTPDAEVAVGIEAVREHYRLLNQIKVPTANNPQQGLEHGDKEQENFQGVEENYLDNSDVDSLNEEVLEDGTIELKRTTVRFPRNLSFVFMDTMILWHDFNGI
ncbi:hypothetical protein Tco_0046257 [Tanacetum coccineum]